MDWGRDTIQSLINGMHFDSSSDNGKAREGTGKRPWEDKWKIFMKGREASKTIPTLPTQQHGGGGRCFPEERRPPAGLNMPLPSLHTPQLGDS